MSTATTSRLNLAAEPRELVGKKVATLRRVGRLPAVVYGHGVSSENVSIDAHEFELLRRKAGQNALIDLSVNGSKARPVLVHDVQVHPVDRRPLHVDLFLVRMTEELTVDVPLVPIGTSNAVENLNGTLMHLLESVKVRALPDHLPQSIEYSIESLVDFDEVVKVSDLTIPGDVILLTDRACRGDRRGRCRGCRGRRGRRGRGPDGGRGGRGRSGRRRQLRQLKPGDPVYRRTPRTVTVGRRRAS
jgi:large subunit ribosomal protein L25